MKQQNISASPITFKRVKNVIFYQVHPELFDEETRTKLSQPGIKHMQQRDVLNQLVYDAYLKNKNSISSSQKLNK